MTSFEEILMVYNNILDSSIEVEYDNNIMKIDNVSYVEYGLTDNLKQITIIGEKSPDQNGNIRKKTIIIKKKEDKTIFNFECEYSGNFFMGSVPYTFKICKFSMNKHQYNRY